MATCAHSLVSFLLLYGADWSLRPLPNDAADASAADVPPARPTTPTRRAQPGPMPMTTTAFRPRAVPLPWCRAAIPASSRVPVPHPWRTTRTDTSFTAMATSCKTDVRFKTHSFLRCEPLRGRQTSSSLARVFSIARDLLVVVSVFFCVILLSYKSSFFCGSNLWRGVRSTNVSVEALTVFFAQLYRAPIENSPSNSLSITQRFFSPAAALNGSGQK